MEKNYFEKQKENVEFLIEHQMREWGIDAKVNWDFPNVEVLITNDGEDELMELTITVNVKTKEYAIRGISYKKDGENKIPSVMSYDSNLINSVVDLTSNVSKVAFNDLSEYVDGLKEEEIEVVDGNGNEIKDKEEEKEVEFEAEKELNSAANE